MQTSNFVNYLMPSLAQTTIEKAEAPIVLAQVHVDSEAEAKATLESEIMAGTHAISNSDSEL